MEVVMSGTGTAAGAGRAAWSDAIDEILEGDHVVALAYATPAKGVVILPVTNFGVRDRDALTVTVNSSVGVPKKLERIRQDPNVALAFHTRRHASHQRPEYVLLQGKATLSQPLGEYPMSMLERWQRFEPWADVSPLWRWWQRVYGTRVGIEVAIERITVWPDLACHGEPTISGVAPLDGRPPSQRVPANGTGPRLNHRRAANRAARLPYVLLGWVDAGGFPCVAPVSIAGDDDDGILLDAPLSLVPPGARRAGLTAHEFGRNVISQVQRKHTGWLEVEPEQKRIVYAPHTSSNYRMPPSRFIYRLVTGGATRLGVPAARRAGLLPERLPKRLRHLRRVS
jgi:Pyridoxamine 5'-phosphate oxidase